MIKKKDENKKEIRYFSMFTGVGGFELGLERANSNQFDTETQNNNERNEPNTSECDGNGWRSCSNDNQSKVERYDSKEYSSCDSSESLQRTSFSCIGCSEIDKYASELLDKRFPGIKNYGDATKINPRELPDFDMLCGGFPCQAFSIAGKRRGFEDTRGTMFFEVARIVKVKRPKIVLLENVKGLLNHNKGETFSVIIQTLSELGYDVQWMVLNSKFFGVPQNRERVFIIGSLRGEPRPEILPFRETMPENSSKVKRRQFDMSGKGYTSQQDRLYAREGIMCCLPNANPDNKILLDQPKIRRLTPTECERLQGFPDGWTEGFSDTQRYKMMGNAVTTKVVEAIANKISS